jgi:RNA 2',3'-cyclic 3'-phosphodiesterase
MIFKNNFKMTDKNYKRLFLGISLGKEICDYFNKLAISLVEINSNIKPVLTQNIHITLKFLGNISNNDLSNVCSLISISLNKVESFIFDIDDSLDGFPKLTNARILFGKVNRGTENIKNIFEIIEADLSKIGFKSDEKNFIPHITIARMKIPVNFTGSFDNLKLKKFKNIGCDKVTLFESILSPKGAVYLNEKEFLLN